MADDTDLVGHAVEDVDSRTGHRGVAVLDGLERVRVSLSKSGV
jgi:hypothetical protein